MIKCPAWRHHCVGSVVRRSVGSGHPCSSHGNLHMTFCSLANSLLAVTVSIGLWNFRSLVLSLAAHWYFCSLAGTFAPGSECSTKLSRLRTFVSCNFCFTSCHLSCHGYTGITESSTNAPTHWPCHRPTGSVMRLVGDGRCCGGSIESTHVHCYVTAWMAGCGWIERC